MLAVYLAAQKITLISSDWVFEILDILMEPHEAYDVELRKSRSLKLHCDRNKYSAAGGAKVWPTN